MDNKMEQFAGGSSAAMKNEQHTEYRSDEHSIQKEAYAEDAYEEEPVQYETMQNAKILNASPPVAAAKKRPSIQAAETLFRDNGAIPPAKFATMQEMTEDFWIRRKRKMENITEEEMSTKSKNMSVPMARVKKIMRIDEEVRNFNIASDAPIFMAQAAEFFIEEMTAMAWQHVSEARRRILLKTDVGTAVQKNDQFDFLIDFLPAKAPVSTRPAFRKNPNTASTTTMARRSGSGEPSPAGDPTGTITEIEYEAGGSPMAGPSTSTASTSDNQFAAPIKYSLSHESSGSPSN